MKDLFFQKTKMQTVLSAVLICSWFLIGIRFISTIYHPSGNPEDILKEQRILLVFFLAGIFFMSYILISHLQIQKKNQDILRREVKKQSEVIKNAYEEHSDLQDHIIEGMAKLVEGRDVNTGAHVRNTRTYVGMIVKKLKEKGYFETGEDEKYAEQVIRSSVLHDVGKIFISDFLLNKPGKLTQDEFDMIKTHTKLGGQIVDELFTDNVEEATLDVIRDIVVHHHEKWDGTGYPEGLSGEAIPLAARIMSVADVFDALASKRPYKEPMSVDRALAVLEDEKGTFFDPEIVDALVSYRDELKKYIEDEQDRTDDGVLQASFRKFEEKVQQESIISGLSNDYEVIFYAKPDENKVTVLRHSEALYQKMSENSQLRKFMDFDTLRSYVDEYVYKEDAELCKSVLRADRIRSYLENGIVKIYMIRLLRNGAPVFHQAKLIRLGKENDRNFDILIGLTDVDSETKQRLLEASELAEAKKQADSANRAKTEFVLNASRNLRTTVTNIVGYTNMLDKNFSDEVRSREYLEKVKKSEEELMQALNKTLDMHAIENGEVSTVKK